MAPETRSISEALAAITKSIEDQAARTQQTIDDLSAHTQQGFVKFSVRTQAVEALVQQQADQTVKNNANTERMMTNFKDQLQGVMQEVQPGERDPGKRPISSELQQPSVGPLLPTPTGGTTSYNTTNNSMQQYLETTTNHLRPPRIDVPVFTGEDVDAWLFQMERYFEHNMIAPEQRLTIAVFYLSGEAIRCYQWLHSTHQLRDWPSFARDIRARFGPSAYWDAEVEINKLIQTTFVTSYITEFESLSTKTPGFTPNNLLKRFLAGLKDEIHQEIVMLHPVNLQMAMGMARIAEQKLNSKRTWMPRPAFPRASNTVANNSRGELRPTRNQPTHGSSSPPFRRLTVAEMTTRREKGLCFNCDEKFAPGHQCKSKFQCLVLEDAAFEDEALDPPDPGEIETITRGEPEHPAGDTPTISYHALQGHHVPKTLKIEGMLHGERVVVLIDTGSTHNFLQGRIARHARLPIEEAKHLNVTVGNGEELHCEGSCKDVKLRLGNMLFHVDFYLLPIYGADAVLGAQWLAELGPIMFNYQTLQMSFEHKGETVQLEGINQPASLMQLSLG
ncbi:unnamed protein product [Rhodiola kirilowii]